MTKQKPIGDLPAHEREARYRAAAKAVTDHGDQRDVAAALFSIAAELARFNSRHEHEPITPEEDYEDLPF